jgi:hypothetical protein
VKYCIEKKESFLNLSRHKLDTVLKKTSRMAVIIVSDVEYYWAIMYEKRNHFDIGNNTCHYCLIKCSNTSIGSIFMRISKPLNPKSDQFSLSTFENHSIKLSITFNHFCVLFFENKTMKHSVSIQVYFKRQIKRFAISDLLATEFTSLENKLFLRCA